MSRRRTARVASVLAPLLALGVLTGTAYGQEPQPSPSATAEPAPSEQPTATPSEQPAEAPSTQPSQPATEPSAQPEPEPTISARPPAPADEPDTAEDELVDGLGANPQQDSGVGGIPPVYLIDTPVDLVAAAQTVATLVGDCTVAHESVCAAARDAAYSAVDIATACVNALMNPEASDMTPVVDIDCRQAADNAIVLATYILQTATDCTSGYIAVCQTVFDLAALAVDRAAGCLAGALTESNIRVVELYGTDVGCADAVAFFWRTAQGAVALLTGCLANQEDLCQQVTAIGTFGLDTLTDCAGEAVIRLTDLPNPLPSKDAPFQCWQAIDQVNHALNDTLGQLPHVPTEISVTDDCVVTTRPRVIENTDDPEDTAQELLVPSCYPPEVAPPVTAGMVVHHVESGALAGSVSDDRECNYSKDFKVNNVLHDWKKRVDEDEATNIQIEDKVKFTLELTRSSSTFTATASGAYEAEGRILVAKVKSQLSWSISYEMEWNATRSVVFEIPPRYTYHYAYGITVKIAEGNWVETLDDCSPKTGDFRRVKAPSKKGHYFWKEPYEGGPPN